MEMIRFLLFILYYFVAELFHGDSTEQPTNRRRRTIYDEEGFPDDEYDGDHGDEDEYYGAGDEEDIRFRRQQHQRRYQRQ